MTPLARFKKCELSPGCWVAGIVGDGCDLRVAGVSVANETAKKIPALRAGILDLCLLIERLAFEVLNFTGYWGHFLTLA